MRKSSIYMPSNIAPLEKEYKKMVAEVIRRHTGRCWHPSQNDRVSTPSPSVSQQQQLRKRMERPC